MKLTEAVLRCHACAVLPCHLHALQDSKYTQQALLEENSTMVRLGAEKELLSATLKYYTAATALEGVFGSSSSSASSEMQPPPGGPD